jgi:hypothetical protein
MNKLLIALASLSLVTIAPAPAFAQSNSPAVKMSRSGICHPRGGTYYSRTTNYTPYKSMADCVKAGGRPPQR